MQIDKKGAECYVNCIKIRKQRNNHISKFLLMIIELHLMKLIDDFEIRVIEIYNQRVLENRALIGEQCLIFSIKINDTISIKGDNCCKFMTIDILVVFGHYQEVRSQIVYTGV